jgi:putative ABC transport system substrate-binding protein
MRTTAKELIDSQPDVILTNTSPATAVLQRETRVIPIVFGSVSDPVGSGFVASLARPGGNITGFTDSEASMAGKWLELLIEIAPGVKRAAIMFNPDTAPGGGSYFVGPFEAAARSFKVEPMIARVHTQADIETVMNSLGREPPGGLVIMPGGLLSYGADLGDIWLRAATYVDRILRGANPADLPVQLPTKFELVINLKTAKALGLIIPETLLATADEVIQ